MNLAQRKPMPVTRTLPGRSSIANGVGRAGILQTAASAPRLVSGDWTEVRDPVFAELDDLIASGKGDKPRQRVTKSGKPRKPYPKNRKSRPPASAETRQKSSAAGKAVKNRHTFTPSDLQKGRAAAAAASKARWAQRTPEERKAQMAEVRAHFAGGLGRLTLRLDALEAKLRDAGVIQ